MKKTILTFALSLGMFAGFSQTAEIKNTTPKVIHKLGLHSGTASGVGLSYKALFNNKTMVQLVTLPVASQDFKYVNSGLSLKIKFKDLDNWDFYGYGSGNFVYIEDRWSSTYNETTMDWETFTSYNYNFNVSGGVAVEYGKGEMIKWGMQAGYGVYNIGESSWMTNLTIGTTIDFALNSK